MAIFGGGVKGGQEGCNRKGNKDGKYWGKNFQLVQFLHSYRYLLWPS